MPFLGRTITTNLADFHTDNYAAGSGFTAGSTTSLALSISGIDDENALRISFDGVNQHHDTWSLSSSTVTFDAAIPTGVANVEIQYGNQPTSSAFEANSVAGSHIAVGSDAQGDVLYYDGSNYARLAAGTSGQFLKTQGSSANPTWAAPAGGGYEFVSTTTASDSASVAFTGFETGYDYMFQIVGTCPASDGAQFEAEVGVSGPTYRTADYLGISTGRHDGGSTDSAEWSDSFRLSFTSQGTSTNEESCFVVHLFDPANSGTDTWVLGYHHVDNTGDEKGNGISGGWHNAAEAIVAIKFAQSTGNIEKGFFKMFRRPNA